MTTTILSFAAPLACFFIFITIVSLWRFKNRLSGTQSPEALPTVIYRSRVRIFMFVITFIPAAVLAGIMLVLNLVDALAIPVIVLGAFAFLFGIMAAKDLLNPEFKTPAIRLTADGIACDMKNAGPPGFLTWQSLRKIQPVYSIMQNRPLVLVHYANAVSGTQHMATYTPMFLRLGTFRFVEVLEGYSGIKAETFRVQF